LKPNDNPFWVFEERNQEFRFIEVQGGYIPVQRGKAYLSCSAGRTHFARTNYQK
jgi:hypothetical protein